MTREAIEEAKELISGPAAWLDSWAQHVGNCKGGYICTCGLTVARTEAAAAYATLDALLPTLRAALAPPADVAGEVEEIRERVEKGVRNHPTAVEAQKDRATLLRLLDAERARRVGWQPIETAPRDGTRVLVWSVPIANYYNADEPPHVAIAYWLERRPNEIRMGFHSGWVWHGMAGCTFTHWQPLPTPPATNKDTQDE